MNKLKAWQVDSQYETTFTAYGPSAHEVATQLLKKAKDTDAIWLSLSVVYTGEGDEHFDGILTAVH
jgi:hypothetical protein